MTNDPMADGLAAVMLWAAVSVYAAIGSALVLSSLRRPRKPR